MKFITLLCLFFSSNIFAVNENIFKEKYSEVVVPFYDQIEQQFFEYSNDATRKFPFKFLKRNSKNLLVILPGKGEQLKRYAETIYDLKDLDVDILIVQFRGQGQSSRRFSDLEKTHIENFDFIVNDLHQLFTHLKIKEGYQKLTLLAHSMGGHHALRYQTTHQLFDQLILNAPMVGPFGAFKTSYTAVFAKFLTLIGLKENYAPGRGGWKDRPFDVNPLSHSRPRYEKIRELDFSSPETRMGGVTVSWAHSAFESEKTLFENISKLKVPVTIFQAGRERVVSNEKQSSLCSKVETCQLIRYEKAKHNFLQETDKYRKPFIDFIKSSL